jgi:hypothetical protein
MTRVNSLAELNLITEKDFESQVKDLAKLFGWKYYHTWRSFHSPAGFPDCVMVREDRLIFAELKSEKGKVSPEQEDWLLAVKVVGKPVESYLWRPSDFDLIKETLR